MLNKKKPRKLRGFHCFHVMSGMDWRGSLRFAADIAEKVFDSEGG
ncbi:hypothetical protein PhaeoP83_01644 [Phaeobacter inhibens]|uniref:Uncharacterized protein n=1 Tax=Phaeobacter inhibens TaxID=221822 RepID=A0ABN5GM53_9RHOB|nr:hypothetical protein PhaeoP83_01644 [Phaeobacter inhibens]AUQ94473.1 hypothetical protein PhaeoP66_01691 [Phaeobacter inhibens]AUR19723.1 hypothetical protein PhaeoP80_01644 [Phaeobacter inhibens]